MASSTYTDNTIPLRAAHDPSQITDFGAALCEVKHMVYEIDSYRDQPDKRIASWAMVVSDMNHDLHAILHDLQEAASLFHAFLSRRPSRCWKQFQNKNSLPVVGWGPDVLEAIESELTSVNYVVAILAADTDGQLLTEYARRFGDHQHREGDPEWDSESLYDADDERKKYLDEVSKIFNSAAEKACQVRKFFVRAHEEQFFTLRDGPPEVRDFKRFTKYMFTRMFRRVGHRVKGTAYCVRGITVTTELRIMYS
ncbi:hypothetical protein B0H63DRAFT_511627 [Podospora didyma]|uniref:Uncharacterized protein n=1 Tax=Podospora didyma TaxID=330526 RepID=A0AAE0NI48_9PEZI|nr:hypothetical protein B0H63DRAFT_511627 [Podospora didyma]